MAESREGYSTDSWIFNLVTSLKSYIDPRIYYEWGRQVDYDWKWYYPKALQKKFNWVETRRPPENG